MDWEPRRYRPGDEDGMLAVLRSAFRRWPYAEIDVPQVDHLRWKIANNPRALDLTWVVEDGDRIVGVYLGWLLDAKVGTERLVRWNGHDSSVLPEYQGKGVYGALRATHLAARRGLADFQTGSGSNPAVWQVWERETGVSWLASPVAEVYLPLRPIAAARREGVRRVPRLAMQLAHALWSRRRGSYHAQVVTVREVYEFDARFDALSQGAAEPFDVITDRSAAHLHWRYDRRAGTYRILAAEDGDGALVGFASARLSYGRGYIADLLTMPGRTDAANALLHEAVSGLRDAGADDVTAWVGRRHPLWPAYRACGFSPNRDVPIKVARLRAEPEQLDPLFDPRAVVHLSLGDLDVV